MAVTLRTRCSQPIGYRLLTRGINGWLRLLWLVGWVCHGHAWWARPWTERNLVPRALLLAPALGALVLRNRWYGPDPRGPRALAGTPAVAPRFRAQVHTPNGQIQLLWRRR